MLNYQKVMNVFMKKRYAMISLAINLVQDSDSSPGTSATILAHPSGFWDHIPSGDSTKNFGPPWFSNGRGCWRCSPSGVIAHGWKIPYKWRFLARKIADKWSIFQQAMFDYQRGCPFVSHCSSKFIWCDVLWRGCCSTSWYFLGKSWHSESSNSK